MNYEDIQPRVQEDIAAYYKLQQKKNLFDIPDIPTHSHTGTDTTPVDYPDTTNRSRFIYYRIVASGTDVAAASTVGGDFVMPFSGNFIQCGATVDTAGTTNATTVNIKKNGTTVLQSDISIASASKTSRSVFPVFTVRNFLVGDIITFDVDSVSTTAPKGLSIFIRVTEISP